jgi:glycosyltransferase involved in cell wall biosynthesis
MTEPLFTVLIDTYNYGQFIEEAVRSALEQDFPAERVEVLVVDDGSTDDTEQRLAKFGDKIRYLRKENGGQASAFNFGLEQARGEFVALLDADDAWLAGKLRRMHQALTEHADAGMAYHRLYEWDKDGGLGEGGHFAAVTGRVTDSRTALLSYPMMQTSCLVFRRAALADLLPIPEGLRTQADAYLTALIVFISPVAAVDEFLGKYRVHGGNLFRLENGGANARQLENRMAMRDLLVREVRAWLRKHGLDTESPEIADYLTQWKKAQEVDRFALRAPGRWEYFSHLAEYPKVYGGLMSPRHVAYSYLRAVAGLVLGYGRRQKFDEFYSAIKGRAGNASTAQK